MSSKRTFLDSIFLLYTIGRCFGLSCYSISKGRIKYKVSIETKDFIKFVAFVTIFLMLAYLNLQLELNTDVNNTIIFNQAQQILLTFSLVFLIIGLFAILLLRQMYWNMANSLNEIDNEVCF